MKQVGAIPSTKEEDKLDENNPSAMEEGTVSTGTTRTSTSSRQNKKGRPMSMWEVFQANGRMGGVMGNFLFSETFQRALLHSKSPEELKAHTIFVMELMVVVGALLTGAAIELWGVFPIDYVNDIVHWTRSDEVASANYSGLPIIPGSFATFFHCMNCLSVVLQLFNTS